MCEFCSDEQQTYSLWLHLPSHSVSFVSLPHFFCIKIHFWLSSSQRSASCALPHFVLNQPQKAWPHPITCCLLIASSISLSIGSEALRRAWMRVPWVSPVNRDRKPASSCFRIAGHVSFDIICFLVSSHAARVVDWSSWHCSTWSKFSQTDWHLGHNRLILGSILWRRCIVAK